MSKQPQRRDSDLTDELIERVVSLKPGSKTLKDRKQINRWLRLYYANVPIEDMLQRSTAIMGSAALAHLDFAAVRKRGEALLRVSNPNMKSHGYDSGFTIIEMVNDNMPFLVDSVSAAINRSDMTIHMTVHPVVRVSRDRKNRVTAIHSLTSDEGQEESFIRLAIDRESDPQQLRILEHEIRKVLGDVRSAVRDWRAMREKMSQAKEVLNFGPAGMDEEVREESRKLLQWMVEDHFTFLGFREYKLESKGEKYLLKSVVGSGLGLLSKEERGGGTIELTNEMRRHARSKSWLIITKANSRSTVHRSGYLDYVGVKKYNKKGEPAGELRFIGLFTSVAYSENPRNIPLLRLKVNRVMARTGVDPAGHRGKSLMHILDTFPRDELFQSSVHDLLRTTNGILNLQERHRVRFFLRRDAFRRFFSCIVYVPREKYTTAVRRRIEGILLNAFDGHAVDSSVQLYDSPLARVHLIVRTNVGKRPRISLKSIESEIEAAVVTWRDKLRANLIERFGLEAGPLLFREYGESFPAAYEADEEPAVACLDVKRIDGLLQGSHNDYLLLYRPKDADTDQLHFRTFCKDEPLLLSHVLPILEDLGTEVHSERPYQIQPRSSGKFWIQDFSLNFAGIAEIDLDDAAKRFQDGFHHALIGDAENDGFNRLILRAGLDWRQVTLIRCYAKFLLQLGIPFSQNYMEDVLSAHAGVAHNLVDQFELQFNPDLPAKKRDEALQAAVASISRAIARARNLDEDRILTAFAGAIKATKRTNYFQTDDNGQHKSRLSIKLKSGEIPEAPLPRPRFEVFVYAPEVEGVHLRGGAVARGGLRWSDRREDFRTEVLGLMKAQVVKNTVIVPTGAKGGFVPKNLPAGDRDAILKEGIDCYKTFIRGLLDITDNVVDGKIVPPPRVMRRDGDDPYLVVAADKGTATFSDIANAISAEYGFWLDDAFASGGSAGYDHKKMGITARGAWEAVKRHFREQGLDTQSDPFTVAGIGDMSGDVFGNGMLLSRKIKLVAAFNHQHIFLDPDPDMARSFKERQRLFKLPRSSWENYNEALISKGGGLFSRQAKKIRLSPEVRKLLDTKATSLQPIELIRCILKMPVDLLWNGGIGTYVKASYESNAEVGDRSNDTLRVDADELRCKVIGEGGNLGLTQFARIEFSLNGGRINTDFIDNSAGVDSSDREVNIKILLRAAEEQKGLTRARRNKLLAEMTDDVAAFVLRSNYLQTQAISMMEARARERLDETARLITNLEKTGLLDRDLEFLPDEAEIEERRLQKQGMTRPEIAVVLSYAKIDLYNGLIASKSDLVDFLTTDPQRYFPQLLRRRYKDLIPAHRLSREILATLIANNIVNRMGPVFVKRIQQDTGVSPVTIARAYVVAREICEASVLWRDIEALDNKIDATVQQSMLFDISRTLRHACYWLIERYGDELDIVDAVSRLKTGMHTVYTRASGIVVESGKQRQKSAAADLAALKVPTTLARKMAVLMLTRGALDISDLSMDFKRPIMDTARMYARLSERLGIVWLHRQVENLHVEGRWQAMARSNLRDDFYRARRDLASRVLQSAKKKKPIDEYESWLDKNAASVEKFEAIIEEMKRREVADFATLSVASQELRKLVSM
ncbi:MAG: NAD-glutamate dehydrogenase [Woeseia sp.]|nr:NAD-glutamate dehydrogenase [Woeseia sp.]MBT8097708.1 NAD-glutamate dehydrogenase [Woeseia sp.]NNL55557.1 NAD-glutamate dehydrogenase [Woeseia sp.]